MSDRHNMLAEYERMYTEADVQGARTVLLMQVGSFWEIYWFGDSKGADSAQTAASLMGLNVTRGVKTNDASPKNPWLAGFPMAGPDKWVTVLNDGWTVAFARQDRDDSKIRFLVERVSPSMRAVDGDGNFACCVFTGPGRLCCSVGIALIDVATGASVVAEVVGASVTECISRLAPIVAARPVTEIVAIGSSNEISACQLLVSAACGMHTYVHDLTNGRWERDAIERSYVQSLFLEAFNTTPEILLLSERTHARGALAYLLHFTRQHAMRLGTHLPHPEVIDPGGVLAMSSNAACQLGIPRLEALMNKASTPMGRRLFKARLNAPSASTSVIAARYNAVDEILQRESAQDHLISVRRLLARVGDLQRWARQVRQGELDISVAESFVMCLTTVRDIAIMMNSPDQITIVTAWLQLLNAMCFTNDRNLLFPDWQEAIALSAQVSAHQARMETVRMTLHPDARLVDQDRMELTKTRWGTVSEEARQGLNVTMMKNTVRLQSAEMTAAWDECCDAAHALHDLQVTEWTRIVASGDVNMLDTLSAWLADTDVTHTVAHTSLQYGLVRPTVTAGPTAHFQAAGVGNIIAEVALEGYSSEKYVRNDISLDDDEQHILLFGINSAGKSTLLRAIGMCVFMAQAGMFVPCEHLDITPFSRIDTRILTTDNIERGFSSFTAEILEMREALRAARPTSLLLADELCNSTEHLSATALVGTLISSLGNRGSRTFVTSHLHDLMHHPGIMSMMNLRVQHMAMRNDPVLGLVYDRRLAEGPCMPSYGIVVAAALGFDAKFVREATAAREALASGSSGASSGSVRKSRYNKRVTMAKCERCLTAPAEDTHHIQHRACAEDGKHNGVGEHKRCNLMPLCRSCHTFIHKQSLTLRRVHTMQGTVVESVTN